MDITLEIDTVRLPALDTSDSAGVVTALGLGMTFNVGFAQLSSTAAQAADYAALVQLLNLTGLTQDARLKLLWPLLPWTWSPSAVALWRDDNTQVALPVTAQTLISVDTLDASSCAAARKALQDRFAAAFLPTPVDVATMQGLAHPSTADVSMVGGGKGIPWPFQLAALSQQPAPIPQQVVQVTWLVRIPVALVAGWSATTHRFALVFGLQLGATAPFKAGQPTIDMPISANSQVHWDCDPIPVLTTGGAGSLQFKVSSTSTTLAASVLQPRVATQWIDLGAAAQISPSVAQSLPAFAGHLFDLAEHFYRFADGLASGSASAPPLGAWLATTWDGLHPSVRTTTQPVGQNRCFTLAADGSGLGVELVRSWLTKASPVSPPAMDVLDEGALTSQLYSVIKMLFDQTDQNHRAQAGSAVASSATQCGLIATYLFAPPSSDMPKRWQSAMADVPNRNPPGKPAPTDSQYWSQVCDWLALEGDHHVSHLKEVHLALRAFEVRRYFWRKAWLAACNGIAAGSQAAAGDLVDQIDHFVMGDPNHPFDLLTRQLIDASAPYATDLLSPAAQDQGLGAWSVSDLQQRVIDYAVRRANNALAAAPAPPPTHVALHDFCPSLDWAPSVVPADLLTILNGAGKDFADAIGLSAPGGTTQPLAVASDSALAHPLVFSANAPERILPLVDASFATSFPRVDASNVVTRPTRGPTWIAHIAGLGVLLRRKTTGGGNASLWRCLSAGGIQVNASPDPSQWTAVMLTSSREAGKDVIVVHALPIGSAGTIRYDNESLVPDPSGSLAHGTTTSVNTTVTNAQFHGFPIDDGSGESARLPWTFLPGLAYGCMYDALCFQIPNAGVLPKELQASDAAPTELVPYSALGNTLDVPLGALKSYGHSAIAYLRRVGVGRVRAVFDPNWIGSPDTPQPAPLFPPIPDGVYPIAREFVTVPSVAPGVQPERPSLLVCFEAPPAPGVAARWTLDTYTFSLLRPTIDAETLHRWHMADWYRSIDNATGKDQLWSAFLAAIDASDRRLRAVRSRSNPSPIPPTGHQVGVFEDPAVTHLIVRLYQRLASGLLQETMSSYLPWPNSVALPPDPACTTNDDVFAATQARAIQVNATVGNAWDLQTPAGGPVSVTVLRGQVGRVTFEPAYMAAAADMRFESPQVAKPLIPTPAKSTLYSLGTWSVDIEGATVDHLDSSNPDHRAAVQRRLAARVDDMGEVTLTLRRQAITGEPAPVPALSALLRQYARATVGYQIHRWDGRPMPAPPRAIADMESADWIGWEVDQFVERSPLMPSGVRDINIPYAPDPVPAVTTDVVVLYRANCGDPDVIPPAPTGRTPSDPQRVVTETRERYYRFQVDLKHRYAAVYAGAYSRTAPAGISTFHACADNLMPYTAWQRVIRPARWRKPVPPPAIKLLVPLTGTTNANDSGAMASDLLVVLNEQWGLLGGLAEMLECSIEAADAIDTKHLAARAQAGPDPIIEIDPVFLPGTPLLVDVEGPIGHTFDTDSSAPLFVNTSFILRTPPVMRPFGFMKVRARRIIEPRGAAGYVIYPTKNAIVGTNAPARFSTTNTGIVSLDPSQTTDTGKGWLALDGIAVGVVGKVKVRPGPDASDDFVLSYEITKAAGPTGQIALSLTAGASPAWMKMEANLLPSPILVGDPTRATSIDLRVVLVRIARANLLATPKVGARWELALYASVAGTPVPKRVGHLVYVGDATTSDQDGIFASLSSATAAYHGIASAEPRYSDYSPAQWCQALPMSTRVGANSQTDDIDWKSVSISQVGGAYKLVDPNSDLQLKAWADADNVPFHGHFHAVLVTRSVTSADGASDTEAYAGIFECGANGALSSLDPDAPKVVQGANYFGRILLIQMTARYRQSAEAGNFGYATKASPDFWGLFFPPERAATSKEPDAADNPLDAALRIVGISTCFGGTASGTGLAVTEDDSEESLDTV